MPVLWTAGSSSPKELISRKSPLFEDSLQNLKIPYELLQHGGLETFSLHGHTLASKEKLNELDVIIHPDPERLSSALPDSNRNRLILTKSDDPSDLFLFPFSDHDLIVIWTETSIMENPKTSPLWLGAIRTLKQDGRLVLLSKKDGAFFLEDDQIMLIPPFEGEIIDPQVFLAGLAYALRDGLPLFECLCSGHGAASLNTFKKHLSRGRLERLTRNEWVEPVEIV